jgi:hypothetical protein
MKDCERSGIVETGCAMRILKALEWFCASPPMKAD